MPAAEAFQVFHVNANNHGIWLHPFIKSCCYSLYFLCFLSIILVEISWILLKVLLSSHFFFKYIVKQLSSWRFVEGQVFKKIRIVMIFVLSTNSEMTSLKNWHKGSCSDVGDGWHCWLYAASCLKKLFIEWTLA